MAHDSFLEASSCSISPCDSGEDSKSDGRRAFSVVLALARWPQIAPPLCLVGALHFRGLFRGTAMANPCREGFGRLNETW